MAGIFLLTILATVAALAIASPDAQRRDDQIGRSVQTSSGSIVGHAAPNARDVSEYLGIPYAQPPVGDLRFAAPKPYNGSGTFRATSFGNTCASNGILGDPGVTGPAYPYHDTVTWGPQGITLLNNEAQANYPSAEDCLTLNVWTKPQSGEAKKAVMVWIYGGGFNFGATKDPWYNGQYLADSQDVVVVTVNYRTNIFGFPGAPGLPDQNAGLLDQRLAMKWVRDNIAGFGGDPSRITLFGQSAGSGSVDYYSFAWYDSGDPIINGMIMQSGTVFGAGPTSNSSAQQTWWQITNKLGCGNQLSPDQGAVLACMRRKSTREILNATSSSITLQQIASIRQFTPVIDERVVFSDYDARAAAGRFIKKPLLIGNTHSEADVAQPVAQSLSGFAIPQFILDFLTQQGFTCPTCKRANYHVANALPVWRYRWFGTWANTVISYSPASNAYHESEIPLVFASTVNQNYSVPDSSQEASYKKYISGAWAAFAKDPNNGLTRYGWPGYNGTEVLQLAKDNATGPNPGLASAYDTGCPPDANPLTPLTDLIQQAIGKLVAGVTNGNVMYIVAT